MSVILHVTPPSPRAFKVLFAAEQAGIDFETRHVDFRAGAHRSEAFRQLNPNQRMPVLEHDGFVLWESNAILEYLDALSGTGATLPVAPAARAALTRWLYWDMAHWDWVWCDLIFERLAKPVLGLGVADPATVARCLKGFHSAAAVLQDCLSRQPFVGGESFTVADLALGSPTCHAARVELPVSDYPALASWLGRVQSLPAWHRAMARMGKNEKSAA